MELLDKLKAMGLNTYPGLDSAEIESQEEILGQFPEQLKQLYRASNGIDLEWFNIYPVKQSHDIKRTWNSIAHVNNPDKSRYLAGEKELLSRFFIFAGLSGPDFAAIDKTDGSLWYSENNELHKIDADILSFIETVVMEVRDL